MRIYEGLLRFPFPGQPGRPCIGRPGAPVGMRAGLGKRGAFTPGPPLSHFPLVALGAVKVVGPLPTVLWPLYSIPKKGDKACSESGAIYRGPWKMVMRPGSPIDATAHLCPVLGTPCPHPYPAFIILSSFASQYSGNMLCLVLMGNDCRCWKH